MHAHHPPTIETTPPPTGRASGVLLATGSGLLVVFMAMHPTVGSHGAAAFVQEAAQEALFNGIVHGTMIGLLGVLIVGFIGFAEQLCLHRMVVRGGLVAYGLGAVSLAGAAIVNGFIVPNVARMYLDADEVTLESLHPLLDLCHAANVACAHVGIFGLCIAVALWSVVLLGRDGGLRVLGVAGLLCGALPLAALAAGHLPMTVHGFGGFLLLQVLWYVAVAVQLIRGRL